MKGTTVILISIALAVILIGVIQGFGLFQGDGPDEKVDQPLALPVIRYVNFKVYDPVYVALEHGFFEDHGVTVEIIGDVLAGPNAIQAVASGAAEAGLSSIPAIINANAAGLPIQGVVDIQTTLEGQPLQKWYVRADDDSINVMEDVCGKTYAVNIWRSSFHYTSLRGLDQRGVDEACVNWVLLSFADQIPALIQGTVDVIGLIQPYQSYLEHDFEGQFREVWNDLDDITGESHVSLIFVNRIWAENNPSLATAFVSGIVDAINFIESDPDGARSAVAKWTGIPEYAIPVYHFTDNGQVLFEDIDEWMSFLKDYGDLTADWVTPEMIATNDYNSALP